MSSSVTVRGDFGFFPLNKRRKPLKSKDERKSSGRYGSWKKNIYKDQRNCFGFVLTTSIKAGEYGASMII
ncbi:hypothetical protein L798_04834 [Zootermopsis nevadensis]|uniref:Uncharacterized protein n=1 Tax=Zootermopsis nevadensis TaxID=136037 RepID=A0A067RKE8_ZOONE|nr:hypothetical protein L798_04834 [Zootermopsis nevadensis]